MHRTTGPTGVLDNPLIQRLVALDLERSDFVIFGSAPLLACGLRKSIRDLDVVARGAAWQRVSTFGLPAAGVLTGDPTIQFWGGRIQCSQQWISPDWDSDKLIDEADMIDGLRFARLADVLAYKQVLLRRKDIDDIRAITSYARPTYQLDLMRGQMVHPATICSDVLIGPHAQSAAHKWMTAASWRLDSAAEGVQCRPMLTVRAGPRKSRGRRGQACPQPQA